MTETQESGTSRTGVGGLLATVRSNATVITVCTVISSTISPLTTKMLDKGIDYFFDGQKEQQERLTKSINSFREEVRSFDVAMNSFVYSLATSSRIDADARKTLLTSLIRQKHLAEICFRDAGSKDMSVLVNYEKALAKFNSGLNEVEDILTMKRFWEAASQLILAREELLRTTSPT